MKKKQQKEIDSLEFQQRIYIALVGAADYVHTMASIAEICRNSFERSAIAVKIWHREYEKALSVDAASA